MVLQAAARGWRLFPVCRCDDVSYPERKRGKIPLVMGWPRQATNNLEKLEAWAAQYPGCNWGMATGAASGVVVIDIDGPEGRAAVAGLERAGCALPSTLTVTTGRIDGGEHRCYLAPPGVAIRNSSGRLGPHIDVRGTGGYAVIPPSTHETGKQYRYVDPDAAIAELPGWVVARLERLRVSPSPAPHSNIIGILR
ncbi:MAG: bifunctional DNA primase/polymerase [Terracidiphilus sp.]